MPVHKYFKVLKFEMVETSNGHTIRCQLEDEKAEEGFFYIHLPKRFFDLISNNFEKYEQITKSKKPFYFAFLGFKGRGFQVNFSRNPTKKHS